MYFLEYIQESEERSGNTNIRTSIKRWFNFIQQDICSHMWDWQIVNDSFVTTAPYETGTVDVTNDSASVSGTGTSWTSAMEGRKFYVEGDSFPYVVKTVSSTTSLTLDTIYTGTTATGSSYRIFQDEYIMPYDCIAVYALSVDGKMIEKDSTVAALRESASPYSEGEPRKGTYIDTELSPYYDTGTISVSTKTVTLAGGTWPYDTAGRWLKADSQGIAFKIASRDSDAQVTLEYEGMIASADSFQLSPPPRRVIRLEPAPDDVYRVDRWYYHRVRDMVHNYDVPEVPDYFNRAIQEGLYLKFLEHQREFTPFLTMAKMEYDEKIRQEQDRQNRNHAKGRNPHIRVPGHAKTWV